MTSPTVSVIMAAYKGAALVGETIESVLAQSFQDFELVIVDDCSPDNTLDVLRAFSDPRIRVIASPVNQGPVKTRNIAMAEARGRYLAGLDQDDICLPDRFARQLAYLDAHPDVVLVAAAADLLEEGVVRPGKFRAPTTPDLLRWQLHLGNPLVWSSVMMRADVARRLDPITRPEILFAEDFDLYHRIGVFGHVARIDEPLLHYRVHPGGVSKTFKETMVSNAERVLAEVYAPIFGADAAKAASLVTLHVAEGEPLRKAEDLDLLGTVLTGLKEHLVASQRFAPETVRGIDRMISSIWWRIVRTAVRSGALPPKIIGHPRPAPVRMADLQWGDMIMSGMIGAARRITNRQ